MKTTASLLLAVALAFLLVTPVLAEGGEARQTRYRVTLENLTEGEPFSPPVAATHDESMHLFQVGEMASTELEAIAEDGMPEPMFERLNGAGGVTQAVNVGKPVALSGDELIVMGKKATDSVTFEITGAAGDRFSIATMLICTNDGFTGLDAVELPEDSSEYMLESYDAGTEENTERSEDIVDHCTDFGPVKLAGDPNGNVGMGPKDAPVSTDPAAEIRAHEGIQGDGELTEEDHGWSDPVARVTITRLDAPGMPSTGAGGVADGALPVGSIAAVLSLLAAGGFGLMRYRR